MVYPAQEGSMPTAQEGRPSTMLEKMAKAAYDDWIADVRDLEEPWHDLPESHRVRMIASQRAALQAIREPDMALYVNAGTSEDDHPVAHFTAMIDAILSEGEKP